MLTKEQLDAALCAAPAPRVTKEYIDSRIASITYHNLADAKTLTICQIVLDNGYSVRGESACVNEANYRADIGEKLAYDSAYMKLWPLFGFLLAEHNKIVAA